MKNIEKKLQKYEVLSSNDIEVFLTSLFLTGVFAMMLMCFFRSNDTGVESWMALVVAISGSLIVFSTYLEKARPLILKTLFGKKGGLLERYREMKRFEENVKKEFLSVELLKEIRCKLQKAKKPLSDKNYYAALKTFLSDKKAKKRIDLLDSALIKNKTRIPNAALKILEMKSLEPDVYDTLKPLCFFIFLAGISIVGLYSNPCFSGIAAGLLVLISFYFWEVAILLLKGKISKKQIKNKRKYFKILEKAGANKLSVSDIAFLKFNDRFDSENVYKLSRLKAKRKW